MTRTPIIMSAEEIIESFIGILDTPAGRRKMGEDSLLRDTIESAKLYLNNPITIHIFHIFHSGEWNGVNAKQNGHWLNYDDMFTTLSGARKYAFELKRKLNAKAVYIDWNGVEINELGQTERPKS